MKILIGARDSKCYITMGVGGTRFVKMRYKGWVNGWSKCTNLGVT